MTNFNFKRPSIELVSKVEDSKKVWLISRPHLSEDDPELMNIKKADLPVHCFDKFTFKITSSLLIRDLLYHIRPTANWARSNRTTQIDKSNLYYSEEYKPYLKGDNFEDLFNYLTDTSINLDIRKDAFAYYISTDYCWGCDMRTLSSLLRSMKLNTPYLFNSYGKLFLKALGVNSIDDLPPGSETLLNQCSVVRGSEKEGSCWVEVKKPFDTVFIEYIGKGSLLSQFIRQHVARVRSSFVNEIMTANSFEDTVNMNQSDHFKMQSITTVELAKKLIKTRACWFSKQDMASTSSWSDIVSKLIKEFNIPFETCLPCNGDNNKCPWKTEQLARCLANKPGKSKGEVNNPCVILTGLTEIGELRRLKFNSNSSLYKHWLDYCNSHNLEITEHGRDYIYNVLNWGFVEDCDNSNKDMINIMKNLGEKYNINGNFFDKLLSEKDDIDRFLDELFS